MTTTSEVPTAATVYVPREESKLRAVLRPGTAIVGSNAEAWLQGRLESEGRGSTWTEGDAGQVLVDYEAEGQAVNIVTFADRAYHAFDRHVRHYPTHKRMLADAEQLWPVAFYWAPEGRVEISGAGAGLQSVLSDGEALYKLADWLGLAPLQAGPVGNTTDVLARELRATHRVSA
jgi:hypothetical protein